MCISNQCVSEDNGQQIEGLWTGSISSVGNTPVGIRFEFHEQLQQLRGQTFVEDPETREFLIDAEFVGSRSGNAATWTTSTGVIVKGTFDVAEFSGTLEFPAEADFPRHVADLHLKRQP